METVTVESIPIVIGREQDGRWWADIESMPGVMAYGATREAAIAAVRALALRVAADCIDHGDEIGPAILGQIAKKTGLRPEDL
jgi:predicted RNase H-like HicB family nuclease